MTSSSREASVRALMAREREMAHAQEVRSRMATERERRESRQQSQEAFVRARMATERQRREARKQPSPPTLTSHPVERAADAAATSDAPATPGSQMAAVLSRAIELGLTTPLLVRKMEDHVASGRFTETHYVELWSARVDKALATQPVLAAPAAAPLRGWRPRGQTTSSLTEDATAAAPSAVTTPPAAADAAPHPAALAPASAPGVPSSIASEPDSDALAALRLAGARLAFGAVGHASRLALAHALRTWANAASVSSLLGGHSPLSPPPRHSHSPCTEPRSARSPRFPRNSGSPDGGRGSLRARQRASMQFCHVGAVLAERGKGHAAEVKVAWAGCSVRPGWELLSEVRRAPGFEAALATFRATTTDPGGDCA